MGGLNYKDAGVEREMLAKFKSYIMGISLTNLDGGKIFRLLGKFSSAVQIPGGFREPALLLSVDGVGTKLKIIAEANKYELAGYDIVNHSVNDIIAIGGTPYYFLDYISFTKLSPTALRRLAQGIVSACRESGIVLVGGETAQMPGFYKEGDFELVGVIVGFVERDCIIDGSRIKLGDRMLALPSSGIHTNGFSLVRKALFEKGKMSIRTRFNGAPLWRSLLIPHRNYLAETKDLLERFELKGIAHITGGGIEENVRRILPKGLKPRFNFANLPQYPIFKLIQEKGNISESEMFRTFNMGAGMVYVLSPGEFGKAYNYLAKAQKCPIDLGEIVGG